MKPCPFCSELIQGDAVKCRYCRERLDTVATDSQSPSQPESAPDGSDEAKVRVFVAEMAQWRPEMAYKLLRAGEPDPEMVALMLADFASLAKERDSTIGILVALARQDLSRHVEEEARPDWFRVYVGYSRRTNLGFVIRKTHDAAYVAVQHHPNRRGFEDSVRLALPHKVDWGDPIQVYKVEGPFETKQAASFA